MAGALALLVACAPSPPAAWPAPAGPWAFTGPWDARSAAALERARPHLAAAVTGWIALDSVAGTPRQLFPDPTRSDRAFRPRRLALVTSWLGERFHAVALRHLGADAVAREAAARALGRLLGEGRYRDIVLDVEELAPDDSIALAAVAAAFARVVHGRGGTITLAAPAAASPAHRAHDVLAVVDRVVVMLYDEHWAGSEPGPVASPAWVDRHLADWVGAVGAARIVAALPTYGYYWRNAAPAQVLGHAELVALAESTGTAAVRDQASGMLRLEVPGAGEAWYSDATAVWRLVAAAKSHNVGTIAFWRLGLDDPALWPERR